MAVEESRDRHGRVADRNGVDLDSRAACSSLNTGASPMHGTHQLAKMLSSRGLPVARSVELRPGLPGTIGASVNGGRVRSTNCDRTAGSAGLISRQAKVDTSHEQQDDRNEAQAAAHA